MWVALFGAYGLYGGDLRRVSHSTVDDLPGIFHAFLIGSVGPLGLLPDHGRRQGRVRLILAFGLAASRSMVILRRTARGAARRVMGPERVLFVGGGFTTAALVQKMRTLENGHLEPVGVLMRYDDPPAEPSVPVIGGFDLSRLEQVLHEHSIDRVVASGFDRDDSGPAEAETLDLLRRCRQLSVKVSLVPSAFDAIGPSAEVDHIGGITVLGVNPPCSPVPRAGRSGAWTSSALRRC